MLREEINLMDLVEVLDEEQSEYADFFRPMLGYDAVLKLYTGIDDSVEPSIVEIEDECGFEFPSDVVAFYMCTNGGEFGDLELFPLTTDKTIPNEIHKLNVIDKSLKESIGLTQKDLILGKYMFSDDYVVCSLNEHNEYVYKMWDGVNKKSMMDFEYLIQIVSLEVAYVADYDNFSQAAESSEE